MYITLLSTLISSCSLNHHLYTDDSALFFLPSHSLRLQHRSPSQRSRSNFVLGDCKSYTELLQDCSLVSVNLPKSTPHSRLHIWLTPHFCWPDLICLQILLLPYSSASLYPSIPRYQNTFHHRHFNCSVQARLLQLSITTCPSQTTRLQQIQNSLAHDVAKVPKSSHITPILRSLHSLKITLCIEYKLLSLTYKVLTTGSSCVVKRWLGEEMYGVWSRRSQANRKTKEDLQRLWKRTIKHTNWTKRMDAMDRSRLSQLIIKMGVSRWMFRLVPAHPCSARQRAISSCVCVVTIWEREWHCEWSLNWK